MKILLTGHLGFIGQHLFEYLESNGHAVRGYDIKQGEDIRDLLSLDILFENNQFDLVIHLAALTGVRRGEQYPLEYLHTNVMGTKNLVDMAEKHGVKRFINFSSSSVYARSEEKKPISEDILTVPVSLYGMSKLMAEHIVKRSSLHTVTIRPFTVYGENGRRDQVLYKWIEQVRAGKPITFYGDGTTSRGYTYVGDLMAGVQNIILQFDSLSQHEVFNLGGSELINLSVLADLFVIGHSAQVLRMPNQPGDVAWSWADITKATKVLGWRPKTSFIERAGLIIERELHV